MKFPFFGKPKEKKKEKPKNDRSALRKRLGRIRKGEHLDRTRKEGVEDLVGGLAKGDG